MWWEETPLHSTTLHSTALLRLPISFPAPSGGLLVRLGLGLDGLGNAVQRSVPVAGHAAAARLFIALDNVNRLKSLQRLAHNGRRRVDVV